VQDNHRQSLAIYLAERGEDEKPSEIAQTITDAGVKKRTMESISLLLASQLHDEDLQQAGFEKENPSQTTETMTDSALEDAAFNFSQSPEDEMVALKTAMEIENLWIRDDCLQMITAQFIQSAQNGDMALRAILNISNQEMREESLRILFLSLSKGSSKVEALRIARAGGPSLAHSLKQYVNPQ